MKGNSFRIAKHSRSDLWVEALAAVFVFSVSLASVCLFLYTLDRMAARAESRGNVSRQEHVAIGSLAANGCVYGRQA